MFLIEKVKVFTDDVVETKIVDTEKEINEYIEENQKIFNCPFYRFWIEDETTFVDYGSHSHHIRYKEITE